MLFGNFGRVCEDGTENPVALGRVSLTNRGMRLKAYATEQQKPQRRLSLRIKVWRLRAQSSVLSFHEDDHWGSKSDVSELSAFFKYDWIAVAVIVPSIVIVCARCDSAFLNVPETMIIRLCADENKIKHVITHTCIYSYILTYTYIDLHIRASTYIYLHILTYTYIYLLTYTYAILRILVYTYIYLHRRVLTYIYLCFFGLGLDTDFFAKSRKSVSSETANKKSKNKKKEGHDHWKNCEAKQRSETAKRNR